MAGIETQKCSSGLSKTRTGPTLRLVVARGHTATNAPDLFRTPKLTAAGPGQYWGGGPPRRLLGCCGVSVFQCPRRVVLTVRYRHIVHRSHFGSRYHIWLTHIASLFGRLTAAQPGQYWGGGPPTWVLWRFRISMPKAGVVNSTLPAYCSNTGVGGHSGGPRARDLWGANPPQRGSRNCLYMWAGEKESGNEPLLE